jgi:hypothetical protein
MDIEFPLSTLDWTNMSLVINEVQGMGWIQILPSKFKSSHPFQFNMVHILPSSKIPMETLPLDKLISTKLTFIKKEEKAKKDLDAKQFAAFMKSKPVHKNEAAAREEGLLVLDELKYSHAVFQLGKDDQNEKGMMYGYTKIFNFLKLKNRRDVGLTIIVTPNWLFVA